MKSASRLQAALGFAACGAVAILLFVAPVPTLQTSGKQAPLLRVRFRNAPVFAQTPQEMPTRSPETVAQRLLSRMDQYLNLSAEQEKKIRPLLLAEIRQVRAISQDRKLNQEQKRSRIRSLHTTTKAKIVTLLTPEQRSRFDNLWKMIGERMEKRADRD